VAAQQHDHAFLVVRDDAHRVLHRVGVARAIEVEEVERDEGLVHAHEHRALRRGLALHQRVVHLVTGLVVIDAQAERAVRGVHRFVGDALDQLLVLAAVRIRSAMVPSLSPWLPAKLERSACAPWSRRDS
jgi:hypothetical protein